MSRLIEGLRRHQSLLRCSTTHCPLMVVRQGPHTRLRNADGSVTYPICSETGIAHFLRDGEVTGGNKDVQVYYDRLGGIKERFLSRLHLFRELRRRAAAVQVSRVIGASELRHGSSVLEVCVGSGINSVLRPEGTDFFGVDISEGILANAAKLPQVNVLAMAQAESLPFVSDAFDMVFMYLGHLNFFNDRLRALSEMHRVCKPGAPVTIVDISPKQLWKWGRIPLLSRLMPKEDSARCHPDAVLALVEGLGVASRALDYFDEGDMWRIVFRK